MLVGGGCPLAGVGALAGGGRRAPGAAPSPLLALLGRSLLRSLSRARLATRRLRALGSLGSLSPFFARGGFRPRAAYGCLPPGGRLSLAPWVHASSALRAPKARLRAPRYKKV